jgi:5-methylthioadenosine/S-adenosylhomocysteine deaminase
MTNPDSPRAEDFDGDRPIVFRGGTVITVDSAGVLEGADVLIVGDTIRAVGHRLEVPEGTLEIDASGGIVMPGMIDTHRHMWQTALRGYGGDWALSQYFVFYYLTWGHVFRAEDIYAGNLLSALESVDQGVTTTLDWSHGLRTPEYGEAALQAMREIPGRFVLAYGNYLGAPWEWSNSPEFRDFVVRNFNAPDDMMGLQLAFDVPDDPDFEAAGAFRAARELGLRVTTHAGVFGVTTDNSIGQMYDGGWMNDTLTYVHAASLSDESYQKIAATGGTVSVSTESEQNAGQGYPSTWRVRRFGIPTSLSMDTSVWWSADFFSAMRSTLSAFRSRDHLESQAHGEPVNVNRLRAEDVVYQATMGGAHTLGMTDKIGSLTPGKKADVVLLKNDESPAMTPILNPYAHVVFQAGTADVHTVVVNGKVVKYDGRRIGMPLAPVRDKVAASVEYVRGELGEAAWDEWMHPQIPEDETIPNPYTYQDEDD